LNENRSLGLRRGIGQLLHPPGPGEARRLADHFARLREKYERATAFPWLPIEPDTPPH
jgi:hypothetical protein